MVIKKKVTRYKSLHTGKSLTIQQFLVESLYANNKIYDVGKYLAGKKYRLNEYKKHISIISRLIKVVDPESLYEIIVRYRVKKSEDLPWRIDALKHIKDLENLPKDYSGPKGVSFDEGMDLRDKEMINSDENYIKNTFEKLF